MGYGSRALEALNSFYSGEYFNLEEEEGKERPEYEQIGVVDPVRRSLLSIVCSLI